MFTGRIHHVGSDTESKAADIFEIADGGLKRGIGLGVGEVTGMRGAERNTDTHGSVRDTAAQRR